MSDTKIFPQTKNDHALAMDLARSEAQNTKWAASGPIPDRFVPKLQQARAIHLRMEKQRKALAPPSFSSKAAAMFTRMVKTRR